MSTPVVIKGGSRDTTAKVTKFGQLVVAPLAYSTPVGADLDATGTAFNFIIPEAGQSVVITDIIVAADKNVSNTTPADIQIFETSAIGSTTVDQIIVRPQLLRASNASFIGLNLLVPEGKFVNATTDDANILITIMFYRVPQEFV